MSPLSPAAPPVAIHLLDATFERPVKSWRFESQSIIRLGRSDDQDVEISDPYVSRNHAEFHFVDGSWVLVSKGRNGVVVNNQLIEQQMLAGSINFRLGPNGPSLRFDAAADPPAATELRTLSFDTLPNDFYGVDRRKVEREVEEIADGEYFRLLQQRAAGLRRRREA